MEINNKLPYILFILLFGAYQVTSAPLVTPGDSGELIAAAFSLGIAHPPGYPLYVLTGKAFSFMPFGDVAARLNILSGALMAFSAVLVYLAACEAADGKGRIAAAALAAGWGLTGLCWPQALYAEVYPLQLALSLSAVLSTMHAVRLGDFRYVILAAFLLGLSLVAHYGGIVFAPAAVFYLLYAGGFNWAPRRLFAVMVSFALGLSPFALLLVRANVNPPVNWGDPDNVPGFLAHISRAAYGDVGAIAASLLGGTAGIAAAAVIVFVAIVFIVFGRKKFKGRLDRLASYIVIVITLLATAYLVVVAASAAKTAYIAEILSQPGIIAALPFAAAGLWFGFSRDRQTFIFLALLLAVVTGVGYYRVPEPDMYNYQPLADKFLLPVIAVLYILAAAGAASISGRMKGRRAYVSLILLALPVCLLALNFRAVDKSEYFVAQDYSTGIMRTLEPRAIFLADGDNHVFLTLYNRVVGGMRPDIDVFSSKNSPFPSEAAARRAMSDRTRPVYASQDMIQGIMLEHAGMLNRMPSAFGRPLEDYWKYYDIRFDPKRAGYLDFESREMLAEYYFNWARDMMQRGDMASMLHMLDTAATVGRDIMWANIAIANLFLEYGYPEKCYTLINHAIEVAPGNYEAYRVLGKYHIVDNRLEDAEEALSKSLMIAPQDTEALLMLADVREKRGDFRGAVEALERYVRSGRMADVPMAEARIKRLVGGSSRN